MRIIIGAPGVDPISASLLMEACFSGCTAFSEELRGRMSEQDASTSAATSIATTPINLESGKPINPNLPETAPSASYTAEGYRTVTGLQHHDFVMRVWPRNVLGRP